MIFFLLFNCFLLQVETDAKNFPEVKRSREMERRDSDHYNEGKEK